MSFYIGRFYIDKRDLFLLTAAILILAGMYWGYELAFVKSEYLLTLVVLLFLAKGIVLPTHDTWVFIAFFLAVILTLFLPFIQVLAFLLFSFILLRILKVI